MPFQQEANYIRYWIDQAIWAKVAKLDHDNQEERSAERQNRRTGNGAPVSMSNGSYKAAAEVRDGQLFMGGRTGLQRLPESER